MIDARIRLLPLALLMAISAGGCSKDDGDGGAPAAGNQDGANTPGTTVDSAAPGMDAAAGGADVSSSPPPSTGSTTPDAGSTPSPDVGQSSVEVGSDDGPLGINTGPFVKYADPFGNGNMNPAAGIVGAARATSSGGSEMTLTLNVMGLPSMMVFGAHLHQKACDDDKGGAHYQNVAAPAGMASSPAYANPINEAWLDFTTDGRGNAVASTTVSWVPMSALAKSIVVHAMKTGDGGAAGAKLACLPMAFK